MRTLNRILMLLAVTAVAGVCIAQDFELTIVSVSNGKAYVVERAVHGTKIYIDRDRDWPGYVVIDALVDPPIYGSWIVRTANDDKTMTMPADHLILRANKPCKVLLAYDGRATDIADWLEDGTWTLTPYTFTWLQPSGSADGSCPMPVYEKDFEADQDIVLGANRFGVTAGSDTSYIPFVVPMDYDFPPGVDAGPRAVAYVGETVGLEGTATDLGSFDGSSPAGIASLLWQVETGPEGAVVNIADPAAAETTATFDTKGTYELSLTATDMSGQDANDVTQVIIRDRADEFLVAHWDFENVTDPNIPELVAGNDGLFVAPDGNTVDPVLVPGAVDDDGDGNPDNALAFDGTGQHMIFPFSAPKDKGSISHWVKPEVLKRMGIYYEGTAVENGWNAGGNDVLEFHTGVDGDGSWDAVYQDGSGGGATAQINSRTIPAVAGQWAHVVMTWDVEASRFVLYVNGVEVASESLDDETFAGHAATYMFLGGVSDMGSDRQFQGAVDDLRVYNFALPLEDEPGYPSVRTLAKMGPLPAMVDAGPDDVFQRKPGLAYPLQGVITDYGADSERTILWTTESGPNGAEAVFADPADPATTATFPEVGDYVLKLTVIDDVVTVEDTVRITVNSPTCEDVKNAGLLLATDLNEDCKVDLADLALMVENWTKCNDPLGEAPCFWPF